MGRFNILPNDIMLEILTRLPTESVLNCKLVCTTWNNLVHHHPSFSQLHLNRLLISDAYDSGKFRFIVLSRERGIIEMSYGEYDDDDCHDTLFSRITMINLSSPFVDYSFVGSCNGLVCFNALIEDEGGYIYLYGPAFICNPITREYIILPEYEGQYWWTGFSYILSTNEYKIVRVYESGGDSNVGIVEVYTLGSGTGWRNAGTMDFDMNNVTNRVGAFANGALHWADEKGTVVLAFHLADEKFSEIPSPPPCLRRADVPYIEYEMKLGVLGNFLSAAFYYDTGDCDILLLKKNKDNNEFSWSKEFSFGNKELTTEMTPVVLTKSGRLVYYGCGEIYSYDPETSSAKVDPWFGKSISQVIHHKNTLVSLKVLGEKDTKTMESSE